MNKVTLLLWISILRPYPGFLPASVALAIGGRVVDALVLTGAIVALVSRGYVAHPPSIFRPLWFISLAICGYAGGLLFYANIIGLTISVRDLYEPHRLFLMTLLLLFSFNNSPVEIGHIWKRLWVGSVLIYFLIVISQMLDLEIINTLVDLIWGTSKSKYVPELGISRQTGFFINPNWAGVFLALALAYFTIVDSMKPSSRLLMTLITIFLVIMSGSRTGLVCAFFVIGIYLLINGWARMLAISIFATALLYVASKYFDILSLFPWHHRELLHVVFERGDLAEVGTFGDRLEIWSNAMNSYFFPSYGFGAGPLKLSVASVLDNQYIKWLVWYGIPGIILHFLFYIFIAIKLYKISKKKIACVSKSALALIVMLLTLLLASVTGAFFDVTQLSFLFVVLCGNVLSAADSWERKVYTGPSQELPRSIVTE